MKTNQHKTSAFFTPRFLISLAFCISGLAFALVAFGLYPGGFAQAQGVKTKRPEPGAAVKPDVVRMAGPFVQDQDLRNLPYIAPNAEQEDTLMLRHPWPLGPRKKSDPLIPVRMKNTETPKIPTPLQTFAGMTQHLACGTCLPPDTDGDVGPNHYIQAVNSSIRIHDKSGNVLAGPITFNAFFAAMGTSTPCGNLQNGGDPVVFYDHMNDRWVVTDFAFPGFPGAGPFYQCIGVSRTSDPVSGGWYLYGVQVDPANPTWIGDYPKFGNWPDAYYLTMNNFSNNTTFNGVRVYALDRNSMAAGGPANAIGFTILPPDLGDQYSLVPASFRTGNPPPAGQPEWFLDVNSSAVAGTVETQVFVRKFHVDFVTPANSVFGVGAGHTPDGIVTVNGFVDAFDSTSGTNIVPQPGTTAKLDTLGDKIMYPMIYQNLGGVESLYAVQTVNNNQGGTGPTGIRWYQFNVTGNSIPATPAQQQTFTNGGDGLWRLMPSLNVDGQGNLAIGYSVSASTVEPGIRYAGRLATDPPNTLAQGEAVMTAGTGHETNPTTRWGDYSTMFVDPTDSCTFYHTNEYFAATSSSAWNTRVGSFRFSTCSGLGPVPSPTPTATPPAPTPTPTGTPVATPTPTATPSPTPPASAGPVTVTATGGTVGPTDYATVQAAFAAINAGTHQGAINVWVMGDTTETVSAALSASGTGGAVYTSVLMLPNGTRTVSGSIAGPLIDLNGADNVRIDGYGSMTLSNTSTGATADTSTIRFINGATGNTVANCTISGSSTVALGTAGGTIEFSTTTSTGNSNNIVFGNNIGPAGANLPNKAIFGLGTTTNLATMNTGNLIDTNNIFDFFNATSSVSGIHMLSGNHCTISNNHIYQTAPRTFSGAALRYAGITLNSTAGGTTNTGIFNVAGNVIGFGASNGTGTTTINGADNEFRGIDALAVNGGTASRIIGNTISGIDQTTSRNSIATASTCFAGIALLSGGADIIGNQLGSTNGSSTVTITATSITTNTTPVLMISDIQTARSNQINYNQIGNVTINSGGTGTVVGFRGILAATTAAATETIGNNVIANVTDNIVGAYAVYGVQVATCAGTITGNTIRNLSGNANGASLVVGGGIALSNATSTQPTIISRNTIHSLSNVSGAASNSIYAIDLNLPTSTNVTGNLIERNFIHSLSTTSTDATCQIWGVVMRGAGRATVQNNMVRLGLDAAGNSITTGFSIVGIRDIAGATASYLYNSVYIGGTGVVSFSNTFAFNSNVVTNTRVFRDNIFWNARSNASGGIVNVAVSVAGTTPNPAGLTMNNNDLYATGTDGVVGVFNATIDNTLADWQAAVGQDANSISADPLFVAPNGTSATVDLHIQNGSPAIGLAAPITSTLANPLAGVTNDFDGDNRNPTTPDIGADERTSYALSLVSAVSRLNHVGVGDFDVPMPLIGTSGVECRANGGTYSLVLTFNAPVTSGAATVTSGTGVAGAPVFAGNTMTVPLTGVADVQVLTVTITNVNTVLPNTNVKLGFLIGDTTGDRSTNSADISQTKSQSGQAVTASNFRTDVNIDGSVNSGDILLVKSKSGGAIAP